MPVDFISSHPYPTTYPLDGQDNVFEMTRPYECLKMDVSWLNKTTFESKFNNAEIHLTEWSSSPSPRDHTHDYLPAATYIVRANLDCEEMVNSMSYWTFTDVFEEGGAGDSIFHGGFGLINYQGIVKPSFHAYRFLNQLGDEKISSGEGYIITRSSKTNKISAILYHYPSDVTTAIPLSKGSRTTAENLMKKGVPRNFTLEINGFQTNSSFEVDILDENHGNAIKSWTKMGMPNTPDREQTEQLKKEALDTWKFEIFSDKTGKLIWNKELLPWSVVFIKEK
ncbi:MAG: hypothetical protein HC906_04445 [Bacteroidales bacterium]|nr:hypothetical protein [Bacteroidales bacterium]